MLQIISAMQTCVVLQPKATTRNAQLPTSVDGKPSPTLAATILRRATAPVLIGTWKWTTFVLHLYGYKTGKADTENKHELPPPHDTILLFGEAVLFATNKDGALVGFTTADYTKFYNQALGGFDDIGSEDSDTDDEAPEEAEEEVEAEVEVEAEEEVAEDDDEKSEEEIVEEDDEEAEAPVRPPPKIVKAKRTTKKMPTWYSVAELVPEPYKLVHNE